MAGALTVAGQWRSFTAFPSILAIAVVGFTAPERSSSYAREQVSVTPTFYRGRLGQSQRASGLHLEPVKPRIHRELAIGRKLGD
jgi:hypothetical protein